MPPQWGGLRHSDFSSLPGVTSAAFAAMLLHMGRAMLLVSAAILLFSSSAFGAEPPDASSEEASEPSDDPHVALGAGGHFAIGIAPAVALGTRVSAEVATRAWSLGLEGRYDAPASRDVRTGLIGVSFVPCLRTRGAWACGVVLASRATVDSANAADAWLFIGIGARFEKHISLPFDFALRLTGEVLGHPLPYELAPQGHRVFRSSVVSILLGPTLVHAF